MLPGQQIKEDLGGEYIVSLNSNLLESKALLCIVLSTDSICLLRTCCALGNTVVSQDKQMNADYLKGKGLFEPLHTEDHILSWWTKDRDEIGVRDIVRLACLCP